MYNNPEQIYLWAKKYVKFNSNYSKNEVILKFIEKANEYIELDTVNNEVIEENYNIELDTEDSETIEENDKNISDVVNIEPINSDNIILRNSGLQLLARLIRLSHGSNKKNTGLTMPFDFSKIFTNLYYVEKNGSMSCRKIKFLMKQYKDFCNDEDCDYSDKDSFVRFYESRYSYINDNSKKSFLQ